MMTTPDTDSAAPLIDEHRTSATGVPGPQARPQELPPTLSKVKNQNFHVSSAVLDAAQKDGEDLLKSLRTTAAGLTQKEAEDRTRTTGPNEVAQEHRQGWPVRLRKIILMQEARADAAAAKLKAMIHVTAAVSRTRIQTPYLTHVQATPRIVLAVGRRAAARRISDGR
jgi:hypothetical protein